MDKGYRVSKMHPYINYTDAHYQFLDSHSKDIIMYTYLNFFPFASSMYASGGRPTGAPAPATYLLVLTH